VIQDNTLPAEIFPGESTWNQFHDVGDELAALLRSSSFGAPTPGSDIDICIPKKDHSSARAAFVNMNASSVRISPDHRVWTPDDAYASMQRFDFGCSFVVARFSLGNGHFSKPLLMIAGPAATPFKAEFLETRALFNLRDDEDLPGNNHVKLPEKLSPIAFSLLAAPRVWVPTPNVANMFSALENEGNCIFIPSSKALWDVVGVLDSTGIETDKIKADEGLNEWELLIPIEVKDDQIGFDRKVSRELFRSLPIPPDPCMIQTWDPSLPPSPQGTGGDTAFGDNQDRAPYKPGTSEQLVMLQDKATEATANGAYCLLPGFFKIPRGVTFPIGTVFDIEKMSPAEIPELIGQMTGEDCLWLDTPHFMLWLQAIKAKPEAFCVDAYPWSQTITLFEEQSVPRPLGLHLQWSLLAQLIWDHAFASAKSGRVNSQSVKVRAYANSLVEAFHRGIESTHGLVESQGFVGSIFNHPYLAVLRPLQSKPLEETTRLDVLAKTLDKGLPDLIKALPTVAVSMPKKGYDFSIPTILTEMPRELVPLQENDNMSSPRTNNDSLGTRRRAPRTPKRLAAFSDTEEEETPVPKRRKQSSVDTEKQVKFATSLASDNPDGIHGSATGLSKSAMQNRSVNIKQIFDPHPVKHSHLQPDEAEISERQWCLPFQQRGQSSLPPMSTSESSAKMAVAIRQATVAAEHGKAFRTDKDHDTKPVFHFSRDIMMSANPCVDTVGRYAHWLSFRIATPQDTAVTTVTTSQIYPSEYLLAPGTLSPTLGNHLKGAYLKGADTHQVVAMVNWLKDRVSDRSMGNDELKSDFDCNMLQSFFDRNDVIQAIQNGNHSLDIHSINP
jgi:hypothetical protein